VITVSCQDPTGLGVLRQDPTGLGVLWWFPIGCCLARFYRPWCFAMGSNWSLLFSSEILLALVFFGKIQPPIAVSDEFLIGFEVLANFLIIFMGLCIVCSKLFQLEGKC
jgi:hypothetical protein